MKSIFFCLILLLCLSGCVALGVPSISEPKQMLVYAKEMVDEDRPEVAETLIEAAIERSGETENTGSLADSYFALGNLYKSPKFESSLNGRPLADHEKALAYFTLAEEQYRGANNFDGMIKSRWAMANVHTIKGDFTRACAEFQKSGDLYREMLQKNPEQERTLTVATGYESFTTMLQAFQIKNHCR